MFCPFKVGDKLRCLVTLHPYRIAGIVYTVEKYWENGEGFYYRSEGGRLQSTTMFKEFELIEETVEQIVRRLRA